MGWLPRGWEGEGHGVSLKGRRISACAPDTEGRRASRAGIAALPLCARGAGKGMTPTCGSGRAVRGGDAGRVERGREGEWETGLRWPLRPWAERVRVLGRASREIGPGKMQVHLRGLELRSGRAGVAGPQGWVWVWVSCFGFGLGFFSITSSISFPIQTNSTKSI